jgi:protein-L-isoaspartate(D-aspartate) O-methyltransferase
MTKPRTGRFPASLDAVSPGARHGAGTTLRPQRPLAEAARDQRLQSVPTGLGLDGAAMRTRMVDRLRADGVVCEPVLQAMQSVPRHRFVDSALANQAYEDTSLPIGLGQTISKPSVVARMLEWSFLGDNARSRGHLGQVLEIGTGCGYQAAVLAALARHVVSIERLAPLHQLARAHLEGLGVRHVRLIHADGMRGHAGGGPYDTIVSAAGGEDLPTA